jgi:hypothetical protein
VKEAQGPDSLIYRHEFSACIPGAAKYNIQSNNAGPEVERYTMLNPVSRQATQNSTLPAAEVIGEIPRLMHTAQT